MAMPPVYLALRSSDGKLLSFNVLTVHIHTGTPNYRENIRSRAADKFILDKIISYFVCEPLQNHPLHKPLWFCCNNRLYPSYCI